MSSSILDKYPFVKVNSRTSQEYSKGRQEEEEITGKIRAATNFCKSQAQISGKDITKIDQAQKLAVEKCLRDNFLSQDINYFGKRQTIFIDLI